MNGKNFWKKLLNIKYEFRDSSYHFSETFFILRRTKWDVIKNVYRSACYMTVILVRFFWKWNFLDWFSKNTQNVDSYENQSSWNRVIPCGQADRQTYMTKLRVVFSNFAETPKNNPLPLPLSNPSQSAQSHIRYTVIVTRLSYVINELPWKSPRTSRKTDFRPKQPTAVQIANCHTVSFLGGPNNVVEKII